MEEKFIDALTCDSVSIVTKENGNTHRKAYKNSPEGRLAIAANEPSEIVSRVLEIWGETPTLTDSRHGFGNGGRPSTDTPTVVERISTLEDELLAVKILMGVE